MTDRPEDIANRNYYNNEIVFRRVRVVSEIDVEWREDDPGYCLSVARADAHIPTDVRIHNEQQISAEFVQAPDD